MYQIYLHTRVSVEYIRMFSHSFIFCTRKAAKLNVLLTENVRKAIFEKKFNK